MRKNIVAAILAVFSLYSLTLPALADRLEPGSEIPKDTAAEETDPAEINAIHIDDCLPEAWYASAVRYAVGRRLMDCTVTREGNTDFSPDNDILRQEVAETIFRTVKMIDSKLVEEISDKGSKDFKETSDYFRIGAEYRDGVRFCYAAGIMGGDDKGRLLPTSTVTREEYAAMLSRLVDLLVKNDLIDGVVEAGAESVVGYADADAIAGWAKDAVGLCLKNGLMSGKTDGKFDPEGTVSRAQMAQVLFNLAPEGAKS